MKHNEKKEYTVRPVECSTRPIHYDLKLCIGCNRCVDTCQCDILMPNQEKGKPPVVMWRLRYGLPKKGCDYLGASVDESGEICTCKKIMSYIKKVLNGF